MIAGKLYPDKSFSLGYVPPRKVRAEDKRYRREYHSQYSSVTTEEGLGEDIFLPYADKEILSMLSIPEYKHAPAPVHRCVRSVFAVCFVALGGTPRLGLSLLPNLRKAKKRGNYGKKGISAKGRKQVKCSAAVLEEAYGRKRLGFATFTLPSLSSEALEVCNVGWGKLVNRLVEALRRELKRANAPDMLVHVSEVQGKRLRKHGTFALHLHLIYVCKGVRGGWYVSADKLRSIWKRVIVNLLKKSGIIEEFSAKASVDCQRIKRSARNYIGKYMSKGQKDCAEMAEAGLSHLFPRQWWGRSLALCRRVKVLTISLCQNLALWLAGIIRSGDYEGILKYGRVIEIERGGEPFVVGFVGEFEADWFASIYQPPI